MAYILTRQDSEEVVVAQQVAWSVRLDVTSDDAVMYPPEVFVFQVVDAEIDPTVGYFTCVASPAQLLEYPTEEASLSSSDEVQIPYFRLSSLTLVSRSAADIETLYYEIQDEISLLRLNLDALERLQTTSTVDL